MKRTGRLSCSVFANKILPLRSDRTCRVTAGPVFWAGMVLVLVNVMGSLSVGQEELPRLEPIPSPAADGPRAELPAINTPAVGESEIRIQPISSSRPVERSSWSSVSPASIRAESAPVTHGATVQESPSVSGPILEGPILNGPTHEMVVEESVLDPIPSAAGGSVKSSVVSASSWQNRSDREMDRPVANAPTVTESVQPTPGVRTVYGLRAVHCPAPQASETVVANSGTIRYYQLPDTGKPTPVVRKVTVREEVVEPVVPARRYYVSPRAVSPASYRQVPTTRTYRVKPVGYEQVRVTESKTTQRPVRIEVTETGPVSSEQPTTVIVPVPVAPAYVPFQPIRNAIRRRW